MLLLVKPGERIRLNGAEAVRPLDRRPDGRVELLVGPGSGDLLPVDEDGRCTRDAERRAHRAVLLEGMSVAANLALPFTLSIDPMAADVRARVAKKARGEA